MKGLSPSLLQSNTKHYLEGYCSKEYRGADKSLARPGKSPRLNWANHSFDGGI
jgi:hypothetical protein